MKLIGNRDPHDDRAGVNGGCRTVLVGVKLDSFSRELLTWSLVKVAHPGDLVIALHVLHSIEIDESTASLLSLVKNFDSLLSVYQGFCNLKQVDLKLKICRGSSVRKCLVREAESYGAAALILGISKSRHRIRSSASVAKYCAGKLPKYSSIFAVNNGKVIFQREATKAFNGHVKSEAESCYLKNYCSAYVEENPVKSCEDCALALALPDNSGRQPGKDDLPDDCEMDNSLALVPIQNIKRTSNFSVVIEDLGQSKPGFLRRVFVPKHIEKPFISVFQWARKKSEGHSSPVVYPAQKQANSNQNGHITLDGVSGAIVPFGSAAVFPTPSSCSFVSDLPEELLHLHEKYSSTCRLYTYQELASATANFASESLIGKGGSSHVYRGCLSDGKELAVKILKPSEDVIREFVQEISIITTLNHKNIISLSGFCFENGNLLLVYDFLSRGSLEENLHGNRKDVNAFCWEERYTVALGVAEALDYLHNGCAHPVIHRDVKSSNILLSDDFEPQLSDFGLATWASSSSHATCTDVAGTFGYLAPEYFMHGRVSNKIDVFAFGVVLLELLSGRMPINNANPKGQESLVMWASPILKGGKLSELFDASLGSDYDLPKIERMVLAATLCIGRAPSLRPQISQILKLLKGDEEVIRWAKRQVCVEEEVDALDGEPFPADIQSHLNLALLDSEDDQLSTSSS